MNDILVLCLILVGGFIFATWWTFYIEPKDSVGPK